jgi:hypothetical protein
MPIALSIVEGCAQSSRSNVPAKYASARRFFARLASEIFLSSLQSDFFSNLLVIPCGVRWFASDFMRYEVESKLQKSTNFSVRSN